LEFKPGKTEGGGFSRRTLSGAALETISGGFNLRLTPILLYPVKRPQTRSQEAVGADFRGVWAGA